jgi:hypothetical protein
MNLFRSEEHIRGWSRFEPLAEEGIISLHEALKLMSGNYFRKRLDTDWVSHKQLYSSELSAVVREIRKTGHFWVRPES